MSKKVTRKTTEAELKYAEYLYVEKNISPQAIADELGKNIKTIYAWRDKYNWEDTRSLFNTGPSELKKILLQAAMRVVKGEVRKDDEGNTIKEVDADSLSKIMKAYDYISKKASPAVCRDILVELDNFISEKEPKLAAQMTQYHRLFLVYKIQQENGGN
jgi:transposase